MSSPRTILIDLVPPKVQISPKVPKPKVGNIQLELGYTRVQAAATNECFNQSLWYNDCTTEDIRETEGDRLDRLDRPS